MRDQVIRAALNQHWAASDSGDFAIEHDIYQEDAVLDYPQSPERILGRPTEQRLHTRHNISLILSRPANGERNGLKIWTAPRIKEVAVMEPHPDVNSFCRDDPGGH
jgi:hypothetical protein